MCNLHILMLCVLSALLQMYGIACAALGMLGTLSTCLAIDAYGPISDYAGEAQLLASLLSLLHRCCKPASLPLAGVVVPTVEG
jgi:Na+/H+-translocating membrane pyrophosphatase